MPDTPPRLSIFLATPGDLKPERAAFARVAEGLKAHFGGSADIEAVLWEREPVQWQESIQSVLDPRSHAIVVVVFFSRMGTVDPVDFNVGPLSGATVTRTEWEFEAAVDMQLTRIEQGSAAAEPVVLLYRKGPNELPRENKCEKRAAQDAALAEVDAFYARWTEDGWKTIPRLAARPALADLLARPQTDFEFGPVEAFEERVRDHLLTKIEQLLQIRRTAQAPQIDGSPFRPLRPFDFADDPRIFCGRRAQREALRKRVEQVVARDRPFVMVSGPSGVGKSSLVRCALLHDLRNARSFAAAPIRHAVIDAMAPDGLSPAALAAALLADTAFSPEARDLGRADPADLADEIMREGGRGLLRSLASRAGDAGRRAKFVLVLDQFEALFEPSGGARPTATEAALARLADLLGGGDLVVVATMRSERMADFRLPPALGGFLDAAEGIHTVAWPSFTEMTEIVHEPLRLAAIRDADAPDDRLLDRLVNDALQAAESLPLLQVVLQRLYERALRHGRMLSRADYAAMGGLTGAIEQHAEAELARIAAEMPGVNMHAALQTLLFHLVEVEVRDTFTERLRVLLADDIAAEEHHALLRSLAAPETRLVVADAEGGRASYRLSHESLLRAWPEVRDLVAQLRPEILLFHRLEEDARAWAAGRGELIAGTQRLEDAEALRRDRPALFAKASALTAFLTRSRDQFDARAAAEAALNRQLDEEIALHRAALVERLTEEGAHETAGAVLEEAFTLLDRRHTVAAPRLLGTASRLRLADPLCAMLRGSSGGVSKSLAFSVDGRRLASAGWDGTVQFWDAASGTKNSVLRGNQSWVNCLAFSNDGRRLASAGLDGTVRLWDAASGTEIAVLRGHEGSLLGPEGIVFSVAFSNDGRRLASAGLDGTVRLWDAASGTEIAVLRGHAGKVNSVAFSNDGRRLASAGDDGTVRLWDTASGAESAVLRGHVGSVGSVAFSGDGRRLAWAGHDGKVRLWDTASGAESAVLRGHEGDVSCVAFSGDGRRLASGGADGTVRLWDAATGEKIDVLRGHVGDVSYVAFSGDGRRLASLGSDDTVRLWDTAKEDEIAVLRGHEGMVFSVAFSGDGRRLASAGEDGMVRLWDAASGAASAVLRGHEDWVRCVAFSGDGRRLALAGENGTVRLWDAASRSETALPGAHDGAVLSVAFSGDGRRLASAGDDGTVRLWDAASGAESAVLRGHAGLVWSVAFSGDGRRLASAGDDGTVRLWDAAKGAETAVLWGHEGMVLSVAFSGDGRRLASAGDDGTARIWDAASGAERAVLRRHEGWVLSVAFSGDGRRLASAGKDGTARIWDAASGVERAVLRRHEGWVLSVAFSGDGRRLASAGKDGTVRLWDVGDITTPIATAWGRLAAMRTLTEEERGRQGLPAAADRAAEGAPPLPAPPDPGPAAPPTALLRYHALMVRHAEHVGDAKAAAAHRARRGTLARLVPADTLPLALADIDAEWARMLAALSRPAPPEPAG